MVEDLQVKHGLTGEVVCSIDLNWGLQNAYDLKQHVANVEGTPACLQRLLVQERELQDDELLSDLVARDGVLDVCFLRVQPSTWNSNLLADLRKGRVKLVQLPPDLRNFQRVAVAALQYDPGALEHVSEDLQGDRTYVLAALTSQRRSSSSLPLLAYVSDALRSDPEVVQAGIKQDGRALEFAAETFRSDRGLVLLAVQDCGPVLRFAARTLKSDPELVLTALGQLDLAYDVKDLASAGPTVLARISRDGEILQDVPEVFKADRDIVLTVLQWDGLALQYASSELRNDPELVFTAMRQNLNALQYASDELRHEHGFATVAVVRNWRALEYLPESMRSDRRIILTALKRSWHALTMASAELQADITLLGDELSNDQDFMLGAIEQDSRAMMYASESLKHNLNFINNAISINGRCIRHLPDTRKSTGIVLRAATQVCRESTSTCVKQTGYACLVCVMVLVILVFGMLFFNFA